MINLFEYQNKAPLEKSFEELELFLDDIWCNREKSGFYYQEQEERIEVQQFVQFLHKTHELKSNKYVGVIHFQDQRINLLPKIFFNSGIEYDKSSIEAIHTHILWWLSYCRKIKFPNYQTNIGSRKNDFFEILIYLFSKYTRELLSSSIYQQYEEIDRELPYIKGRLNSSAYINENISKGRWHKLNCTYDAFIFDNQFNQIIKHVAMLLFNVTGNQDNKKYLREILFILDEVSDRRATAEECKNIKFNPMFDKFKTVKDYCLLFLNNCISFNYKQDLKLFAFLLPMEYIFEDFIFGFIEKEIDLITAKAQVQSKCLDKQQQFGLKPDLLLSINGRDVIADTKYKIIYSDENDPKKGISQSDLYQMTAYAIRFSISEIILFYPDTITNDALHSFKINIEDAFADNKEISISAYQLPIINRKLLNGNYDMNVKIADLFLESKDKLIETLQNNIMGQV
jgi:5-methylcytosine-specific restriction enzyme subunit McrC